MIKTKVITQKSNNKNNKNIDNSDERLPVTNVGIILQKLGVGVSGPHAVVIRRKVTWINIETTS